MDRLVDFIYFISNALIRVSIAIILLLVSIAWLYSVIPMIVSEFIGTTVILLFCSFIMDKDDLRTRASGHFMSFSGLTLMRGLFHWSVSGSGVKFASYLDYFDDTDIDIKEKAALGLPVFSILFATFAWYFAGQNIIDRTFPIYFLPIFIILSVIWVLIVTGKRYS